MEVGYFSIGIALYFADISNLISKEYLNTVSKRFFNNFSFFDWPIRICICPLVDSFTSLIEMLLIFMKKEFLKAGKLIYFLFPFYVSLIDAVGGQSQKKSSA